MAVEPVALEVVLVVDEIVDDAAYLGLENAAVLAAPGHRHTDAGDEFHLVPQLLGGAVVQGHHHPAADEPGTQGLGQRARYIRKAACGGKGQRFTGAKQYFHK